MKTTIYPDQSLLPKIYLTWENIKDGRVWLNCETGNKIEQPEEWMKKSDACINYRNCNNKSICVNSGAKIKYAYCKYHSETKLVEFAIVEMNSNRTGGARRWEYAKGGKRYFLDKDKRIYKDDGKEFKADYFYADKNHTAHTFVEYIGIILRCNYNNYFINEFKKFIGKNMVVMNNGRHLSLEYPWHIQMWLKYKSGNKTTGKVQKIIDEITNLPHSDISDIFQRFSPIKSEELSSNWGDRYINDVIYFEKLNDQWSVLRYCYRAGDYGGSETYRVYISEDGDCKITKLNDNNEWIPARNLTDGWSQSYGRIVNIEDTAKSKRLSYIIPIVKEIPEHKQLPYLVSVFKFPEIEKLHKMGYKTLAKDLIRGNTTYANIKHIFGEPNKKAKNIFGELGVNKYQLDAYTKACEKKHRTNYNELSGSDYHKSIHTIKHYFGNDISAMDNKTFDRLLLCTAQLNRYFWRGAISAIDGLHVDGKKLLKNIARLSEKHDNVIRIYNDAIQTYNQLETARRPEIDWIFDSYSDVVRVHDALSEILTVQNAERRARWDMTTAERLRKEDEDRIKTDEKRKIFEYEDDSYIIRLPKDNNEIVTEGLKQHICIGGYTSRHSRGDTNLFFLREKATPDQPFYAIEMSKDNQIVQIHGFGNKWLGNDPEAIPTVVRWLRKHNIKCDQKILTCKSTGYSRVNAYVEMPVVD